MKHSTVIFLLFVVPVKVFEEHPGCGDEVRREERYPHTNGRRKCMHVGQNFEKFPIFSIQIPLIPNSANNDLPNFILNPTFSIKKVINFTGGSHDFHYTLILMIRGR